MPYTVRLQGCFSLRHWDFDHLGDAKRAHDLLCYDWSGIVGHYVSKPYWYEWTGWGGKPRVYETFDEFLDEFEPR